MLTEHFCQEARCYRIEQKKYLDTGSNAPTLQSKNMPAKKCSTRKSAPKRKPAAKRKSSTTTRRSSSTTRRPSTASRSRSRSASTCGARGSSMACTTGCRSPYMMTASGRCGAVPCVDGAGNPLMGFVRNSRGECAPKNCGAGYVFNPATGKCVTQNSYMGQQLLQVKKVNDAHRAKAEAQKVIDQYDKASPFTDSAEDKLYKSMIGGTGAIAEAQSAYRTKLAETQKQRQENYEKQLQKAYDLEVQRSKLMSSARSRPCSATSPYGFYA